MPVKLSIDIVKYSDSDYRVIVIRDGKHFRLISNCHKEAISFVNEHLSNFGE